MVREAIFNILGNYVSFDEANVIDLCAGTGLLGFEALSRGAAKCIFVDMSRKSIELIEKTAAELKIPDEGYSAFQFEALSFIKKYNSININLKFDLAFIDPPYAAGIGESIISELVSNNLMQDEGIIMLETSSFVTLPVLPLLEKINERSFGETKVTFYSVGSGL
jgi:16S rRNA (guanine(966)-N(2))-methyltransferase RsmD